MAPRRTAAALAACLLLAGAGVAANHGVEVLPGDRFTAEISPAADRDSYVLPLSAGSRLSLDVKAAAGSALHPVVEVRGPDGEKVPLGRTVRGEGGARVQVRSLAVAETGTWLVVVAGGSGTTGAYEASFAAKSPTRFATRGLAVPAGQTGSLPFAAGEGSVLSFVLKGRSHSGPSGFFLRDPEGNTVPIPAEAIVAKGGKFVAKAIPLSGPYGTWQLRVVGFEVENVLVDATLVVKAPKPRKLRAVLGPEPRPANLSPTGGRDGIAFTVTGQGFDPQARVRFGESPATGTEVTGGTSVAGLVPDGGESAEGGNVAVVVVNPDGQENAAPQAFQYLGVPKPESVTPAFLPPEGGRPVVIKGRNFRAGFALSIGGVAIEDAVLTPLGDLQCIAPARPLGAAAIVVTDEFGRPGTLAPGLQYVGPPAPASVSPPASSFTGGRLHVITGTGFRDGHRVLVGGAEVEDERTLDGTHLRFRMPAGPAGPLDVTVVDEFDREGTGAGIVARRGPFAAAPAESVPGEAGLADHFAGALALGDLDGDGAPEILLASSYARYEEYTYAELPAVQALRNDGAAAFADASADLLGGFEHPRDFGQARAVLLGDLDGDGRPEAILASPYPIAPESYVFTKDGKATAYGVPGYYGTPYADFPTYVATRILGGPEGEPLSDGTAARMPPPDSTPFNGFGERWQAAAGALGDLDGDGDPDLVLAAPGFLVRGSVAYTTNQNSIDYLVQGYQYLASTRVLRNDGSGIFAAVAGAMPALTFMNGYYATRVAEEFDASAVSLGDVDGDGDRDLVLVRSYPKLVYHLDTTSGTYSIYYTSALRVLRNDGTGAFARDAAASPTPRGTLVAGSTEFWQGTSSALGDLDGDGDLDLVVGRPSFSYWYDSTTSTYGMEPAIRVFRNDGTGRFSEASTAFLDAATLNGPGTAAILDARGLVLGDLDGDESPDLVVVGQSYDVYAYPGSDYGPQGMLAVGTRPASRILLNDGAGRLKDRTAQWLPTPAGSDLLRADAAALGDLDGDGDLDLVLASETYPDTPDLAEGVHRRPLRFFLCE